MCCSWSGPAWALPGGAEPPLEKQCSFERLTADHFWSLLSQTKCQADQHFACLGNSHDRRIFGVGCLRRLAGDGSAAIKWGRPELVHITVPDFIESYLSLPANIRAKLKVISESSSADLQGFSFVHSSDQITYIG